MHDLSPGDSVTHARLRNHSPSAFAAAVAARVDGVRRLDRRLVPQGGLSSPPWPMRSSGRRRITSYTQ
jgi:hypothetical protein